MEGPVGHDDVNSVLFAGVIYDLSAKQQKREIQIRTTESLRVSGKSLFTKLMEWETVTQKSNTYFSLGFLFACFVFKK